MSSHPFVVGQKIRVRKGRATYFPELQEGLDYTVTETGVNNFPPRAMVSPYWVKIDPPTERIVFWGTNLFESAEALPAEGENSTPHEAVARAIWECEET